MQKCINCSHKLVVHDNGFYCEKCGLIKQTVFVIMPEGKK